MNKTLIIIIFVLLIVLGIGTYFIYNNKEVIQKQDNQIEDNNQKANKVLVVYYSAQNHTEKISKELANNLNADIFKIEPVDDYTSADLDWTNNSSRVTKEHNDETLRDIKLKNTKIDNWQNYDIVLIGYPIWWGIAAWPVNSFVKSNDFSGKIVIPFCTSASSSIGNSGKLLENDADSGDWMEGQRFSSNASSSDIKKFSEDLIKKYNL